MKCVKPAVAKTMQPPATVATVRETIAPPAVPYVFGPLETFFFVSMQNKSKCKVLFSTRSIYIYTRVSSKTKFHFKYKISDEIQF